MATAAARRVARNVHSHPTMVDASTSQQRICWFLETVSEPTFVVDAEGRIAMANAHASDLFGYPRNELVGVEIEALIPAASRGRHRNLRNAYHRAPLDRSMGKGLQIQAERKDGSRFHADVELRTRRADQGPVTIAVVRDLSNDDLEKSVYQIQDLTRRLHLVRLASEDASEMISNTCEYLDAIDAVAGGNADDGPARAFVAEARSAAQQTLEIVEQLIRYSDTDGFGNEEDTR